MRSCCSAGAATPGKRASVDDFSHPVMGKEYVGCHQGGSIAREVSLRLFGTFDEYFYTDSCE